LGSTGTGFCSGVGGPGAVTRALARAAASNRSPTRFDACVNRNDVTQLLPLLDAIPPVRGRVGRPRHRPDSLFADRGYDHDVYREQVRDRGIVPAIARRGTRHGTYRWVVERSFAWLHGFRRMRIRWNGDPTSTKRSSNSPLPHHTPTTRVVVIAVASQRGSPRTQPPPSPRP